MTNNSHVKKCKCSEVSIDISGLKEIVKEFRGEKSVLIPLLQKIQSVYGYIPKESVACISEEFGYSHVEVYGVITFYSQFYLEPRGKHKIKVCTGTACYIMGGRDILIHLTSKLKIKDGESTEDGLFYLESVACLGCCGMAPVVEVDGVFHGQCSIQTMEEIIKKIQAEDN